MSRSTTATLAALGVGAAGELTAVPARVLPVRGELAEILPWGGLRRGSTVSVRGSTSLLLALLAEATAEGCWAAIAGLPRCGALAAAELGVAVQRLALVPRPGRDQSEVERTVAALLDGFAVVAVATQVSPASARKLSARARHRKAVLVPFDISWPGADVELAADHGPWSGLTEGHGLLASRDTTVRATGRGAATRTKSADLPLPAPTTTTWRPTRPALHPVPALAPHSAPPHSAPPHSAGMRWVAAYSAGTQQEAAHSAGVRSAETSALPLRPSNHPVPGGPHPAGPAHAATAQAVTQRCAPAAQHRAALAQVVLQRRVPAVLRRATPAGLAGPIRRLGCPTAGRVRPRPRTHHVPDRRLPS